MADKEWYDILIHTSSRFLGCLLGWLLVLETDDLVYFLNTMMNLDKFAIGKCF